MSGYIVLTASGVDQIELPNPKFGYYSELQMAFDIEINPNSGEPISWDNGIEYDYRTCHAEFLLTPLDKINIYNWLKNTAAGRCNTFGISCQYSTGFHIFGPDCGHTETYTVNELRNDGSGRLHRPFNRNTFEMDLLMVTRSGSALPSSGLSQGSLQIGLVTGLPYPEIKPKYTPGWSTEITAGGDPDCLDTGINAAYHSAEITIDINHYNVARLIYQLQNKIRNGFFEIVTPYNSAVFGVENGDGTFRCKLQTNKIRFDYTAVDRFKVVLPVWMGSKLS
jgi:hypothetical protein